MGICFHSGYSFLRAFQIKRYMKRDVKMPCRQVALHRGPAGEPGKDSLVGTF